MVNYNFKAVTIKQQKLQKNMVGFTYWNVLECIHVLLSLASASLYEQILLTHFQPMSTSKTPENIGWKWVKI